MERGPAEMRLDQAIELLKGQPGSIERLGPEFGIRLPDVDVPVRGDEQRR